MWIPDGVDGVCNGKFPAIFLFSIQFFTKEQKKFMLHCLLGVTCLCFVPNRIIRKHLLTALGKSKVSGKVSLSKIHALFSRFLLCLILIYFHPNFLFFLFARCDLMKKKFLLLFAHFSFFVCTKLSPSNFL